MSTPALRAGIARRDITPPPGTELFGYSTIRHGHNIDDRLAVTALVLQSADTIAALVSLDWCLVDEREVDAVRREVSVATGIEAKNITLCATHTHSAPITVQCWGWGNPNFEYLDTTRPLIVAAVQEAQSTLQPVRVGVGVTATSTGINRREIDENGDVILGFHEWGPRDTDLTVIRFESMHEDNQSTLASLVHLTAHPTSRGREPSVSRDWPGVMMDRVEKVTGAPVLFINGSFGDVAPRTNVGGATGDGAPAAQEVGLHAATDALRAWQNIKEFRDMELEVLTASFEMPFAPLPSREEAERQLAARPKPQFGRGEEEAEWQYWNAVVKAHRNDPKSSRTFEQIITRLGPIAIVPFAGEVFSEIALRLKKSSPFPHTLVAGTSNGCHGYYVTREARGRGGYEVWVARAYGAQLLADNIDDVLVTENLALLRRFEVV